MIAELAETIKGCSRCGYCMVECPAYGATKIEWDAARGRNRLADEMVKGVIDFDEDLDDPVDTCLRCGSCRESCPSRVDTPKAVQLMRTIRYKAGRMKVPYRLLFEQIMPRPKLMAMGAYFMSGVQTIAPDDWLKKGMIVRMFPPAQLIPKLPRKHARSVLPVRNKAIGERRGTVLYFLGCATDLVYPEVAMSTVSLLTAHGMDVTIPPVSCCGLPAYSYGHIDGTLRLARQNLASMNLSEVDAVVSDCPTCISFLKEYKDLPLDDCFLKEQAEALCVKLHNLPDYLLQIGLLKPKKDLNKVVTYHRPCHFRQLSGGPDPVERILKNLPGVEFRKAENQNSCCGGAGSYCLTQFDRSQKIADKKLAGIVKTNSDVLVTNCPGCMVQLQPALKQYGEFHAKSLQLMNFASFMNLIL